MKYCVNCLCSYSDIFRVCPACGNIGEDDGFDLRLHRPGEKLQDRYIIGKCVGIGGSGCVYRALDTLKNIYVAVKELYSEKLFNRLPDGALQPINTEFPEEYGLRKNCFFREAKLGARAGQKESFTKIFDCFECNGTVYIISEFMNGMTLEKFINISGTAEREAVFPSLASEILEAVNTLHSIGIVHRDLSPDNIMLEKCEKSGRTSTSVKIIDFGSSAICGTRLEQVCTSRKKGYTMPLEQQPDGGTVNAAEDVYSCCAVLYSLLTGKVPSASVDGEINPQSSYIKILSRVISGEEKIKDIPGLAAKLGIHLRLPELRNKTDEKTSDCMKLLPGITDTARHGALPRGTCLEDRYLISKDYIRIADCFIYRAYDLVLDADSEICEFYPVEIASRDNSEVKVCCREGKNEYFRFLSDLFEKRARDYAAKEKHARMLEIDKISRNNGTVYLFSPCFRQFIPDKKKNIAAASAAVASLLDTLSCGPDKGVNYSCISPDLLLSDGDGLPMLRFPYSIYSVRQNLTEETPDYENPNTDVYSLAQSIYYICCGTRAPDIEERMKYLKLGRRDPLNFPGILKKILGARYVMFKKAFSVDLRKRCGTGEFIKIREVLKC